MFKVQYMGVDDKRWYTLAVVPSLKSASNFLEMVMLLKRKGEKYRILDAGDREVIP